jgi:hypothetical protein
MRIPSKPRLTLLAWLSIGIAAILLTLFLLDRYLPGRAYNRAKAQVTKELAEIQISKEPVFEEAKSGCGVSYGLLVTTHGCSYGGEKLYKGENNLLNDVLELDRKFRSLGWKSNWTQSDIEKAISSRGGDNSQPLALGSDLIIAYSKGSRGLSLMVFDQDSIRNSSSTFNRSIFSKDHKGIEIKTNQEYVYGLGFGVAYSTKTTSRSNDE